MQLVQGPTPCHDTLGNASLLQVAPWRVASAGYMLHLGTSSYCWEHVIRQSNLNKTPPVVRYIKQGELFTKVRGVHSTQSLAASGSTEGPHLMEPRHNEGLTKTCAVLCCASLCCTM